MHVAHLHETVIHRQRLGRHVHHDPRSLDYRAPVDGVTPRTKVWRRHTGPFDQGDIGSCTGNAIAGLAMTDPEYAKPRRLDERAALRCYKMATTYDDPDIPGHYPPDDTGSSGLAACKAAVHLGWASKYLWGFGLDDTIRILSAVGPCAAGTSWLTGMDNPDDRGVVRFTGRMRGGHEWQIVGVHLDTSAGAPIGECIEAQNSWGKGWGVKGTNGGKGGRFFLSLDDLGCALDDGGDVVTLATDRRPS